MLRSDDVIGLPVITSDTDEEIGEIKDVIVQRVKKYVVGFLVRRPGWFQHLRVLPLANVKSIAETEVVVESDESLLWFNKAPDEVRLLDRKPLPGSTLITTDGHEVGRIQDFAFDQNLGVIDGFDVEIKTNDGLLATGRFLQLNEDVFVGKYDVIISDPALERLMTSELDGEAMEATREYVAISEESSQFGKRRSDSRMEISKLDNTADLFQIDRDGTSMTVHFGEIGEPDDLSLARLREQLLRIIAEDHSITTVRFDVAKFPFLPSIMLGMLANLKKQVRQVEVLNPSRDTRDVLRMMGFDKLLTVRN